MFQQNKRLAENHKLRIYLIRNGISQRDIAKKLGVSEAYISDIVKNTRKAFDIRRRMVRELGIPPAVLGLDPREFEGGSE